jgi:hypothetical protein
MVPDSTKAFTKTSAGIFMGRCFLKPSPVPPKTLKEA